MRSRVWLSLAVITVLTTGYLLRHQALALSNKLNAPWKTLSPATGWRFAAGNFSGDYKADIVGYKSDGTLQVAQNLGSSFGTFSSYGSAPSPSTSWTTFVTGTFAGDKKSDVVGYDPGSGKLWVGTNGGSSFSFGSSPWATLTGGSNWSFIAGDYAIESPNNEWTDLIGYNASTGVLWLAINVGTAFHFYQWGAALPGNSSSWPNWKFVAGDFVGDHRVDILGYDPAGKLWVGENTGAGPPYWTTPSWNFGGNPWYTFTSPNEPTTDWRLVAGNFDRNGKDDLIGHDPSTGRLVLFTNAGNKFLSSWEDTLSPHVPESGQPAAEAPTWSVVSGEFQSDTRTDVLAYASPGSGGVGKDYVTGDDDYNGKLYIVSPGVARVAVPLYKFPTGTTFWNDFDASDLTARFAVIAPRGALEPRDCPPDPNNPVTCGSTYSKTRTYAPDDTGTKTAYLAQRKLSRKAGKAILGYVSTNYGFDDDQTDSTAYLQVIKDVIDRHYLHYKVDGIFIDEVSTDCNKKTSLYQPLYDYVKTKGGAEIVVLNPGTNTDVCFMSAADIIMDYEKATYATYHGTTDTPWTQGFAPGRFWHIVHSEPNSSNMGLTVQEAKTKDARWLYVTDKEPPDHYRLKPGYWDQFLTNAAATDPAAPSTWRYCNHCGVLHYGGNATAGACPGNASGHGGTSGNYTLVHEHAVPGTQNDWRYCSKCEALVFTGNGAGFCKAGGGHDTSWSGDYRLYHYNPVSGTQSGWRFCNKCQALYFAGNGPGQCPADTMNGHGGTSGEYALTHTP